MLEKALRDVPQGVDKRWEAVAAIIGTKDKNDCVKRFKRIRDMIQKGKEEEAVASLKN